MADAPRAVDVFMHGHATPHEVTPQRAGLNLEAATAHLDGVVIAHDPLMVNREDPVEIDRGRHEGGAGLGGRHRKAAIEPRAALGGQPHVGRLPRGDPLQPEFLGPAALQGAVEALLAAARLRRMRRDRVNAELGERAFHLRLRPGLPAGGVWMKWLARSLYNAQNTPCVPTTARSAAMTVRVFSSSTNCA